MEQNTGTMNQNLEVSDDGTRSILLSLICSLLLCPIAIQLTQYEAGPLQKDILACILTIMFSGILLYIVHNIFKQRCQPDESHEKSQNTTKFNVFTSNDFNSYRDKHPHGRRKIDAKYFKPNFIYHELLSFWGTTYTVIAWGSVYVIGGTIIATEKLAQKIKTKCTREPSMNGLNSDENRNANYWAGSFASYSTSSGPTITEPTAKSPMRRATSWTKKSYSSARKKLSKLIGSGVPQPSMAALGSSDM